MGGGSDLLGTESEEIKMMWEGIREGPGEAVEDSVTSGQMGPCAVISAYSKHF